MDKNFDGRIKNCLIIAPNIIAMVDIMLIIVMILLVVPTVLKY